MQNHRPNLPSLGVCASPSGACGSSAPPLARAVRTVGAAVLAATLAGCYIMSPAPPPPLGTRPAQPAHARALAQAPARATQQEAELAAFKAVLSGHSSGASASAPGGELVAVLNRDTGLLRWKLTYAGLSGKVRGASFDQPAKDGRIAAPVLSIGRSISSPYEGRAMLTPEQRNDLLAGRWSVSLRTARFPEGELRGAMVEQK